MEYKEYTLRDIIKEIIDYRGKTPKKLGAEWSENGYKALSAKNIKTGKIVQPETIRYVDEELYHKWMKQEVEKGTILITSEAPFGEVYYWNTDEKVVLSQRIFGLKTKEEFDSMYIYYWMIGKEFKDELNGRATGTTVTGLRQPELLKCKVIAPNIKEQRKISKILVDIDKKIELNSQINDNLSELVLTLFKEFINSEKDNCELVKLKDCVQKIGTGADAIQRAPIVDYDTGIRCIRVGDMTNNRKHYEWGFAKMTDKDFENYRLDLDDIVITRTAVNGITTIITDNEKIVCNNGLIRLKVNNKYNPNYIYLCTKTKDFYDYIHRIDSETSVRPNMKVDYFTSYEINKISLEKQNRFCDIIKSMIDIQKELEKETHNLEQLRDTLLPKLMNGEIDLENIEI